MGPSYSLKPFQKIALQSLKEKKIDLLCIAPTGSGKGTIVEEIAKDKQERILLLSPLIALGRQQQKRLLQREISAVCHMGENHTFNSIPKEQVWILSPESALSRKKTAQIKEWRPTLVVVDECHCIHEWGREFRPHYGEIPRWIKENQWSRTLWMSATVSLSGKRQIETALERPLTCQGHFSFPDQLNIQIVKTPWDRRMKLLLHHIKNEKAGGIIFTGSRELTERLHRLLLFYFNKRRVHFYHAGLSSEERKMIEIFISTEAHPIVIATTAFGMGMDYPQLEWVWIWQPLNTPLGLAQALGRVGRNKKKGKAILCWDEADLHFIDHELSEILKRSSTENFQTNLSRFFL